MTNIYFNYGSMNSGKSLDLIRVAYNYQENGISVLALKPSTDDRKTETIISRVGLELEAHVVDDHNPEQIINCIDENLEKSQVILVEEANFFSASAIDAIIDYAYELKLDTVIFYGLKVDFQGKLFPGSQRVIERADKLIESTSICWCGKKARQNGRVVDGKLIRIGPQILVENATTEVEYVTLCNYHYYSGQLEPQNEE